MNAAGGGGRVSRSDENDAAVLRWLLEGDPSISWQVLADLVGASQDEIDPERAQVGVQGWGARLLAAQSDDGRWADALYSPKWTSTTYTLLLLHWLGLPRGHPQAIAGCRQVWDGARFFDGGLTLAKSIREPETCITGMLILLASSFGLGDDRLDPAVRWLAPGVGQFGPRSRVLPGSPAVSLAAHRRSGERGIHPIPLSPSMAL